MQQKNMAKADFVTSIGLSLFGLAILIMSIQMPRYENLGVNPYSVPGVVPGLLGLILLILGLVLLIRSIMRKGYQLGLTIDDHKAIFHGRLNKKFSVSSYFLPCLRGVFVNKDPLFSGHRPLHFIFYFDF